MIVKNESKNITENLEDIKDIFDEIIIVDTGSADNTKEVALNYTDKIFDFKWRNSFSDARNFSFSKASMQYTFWLDADDYIADQDRQKILTLKQNLSHNVDSVSMLYVNSVDESGKPLFSFRRNRIVKTSRNFKWCGDVHEYIDVRGNILNTDIKIIHGGSVDKSERNLDIYRYKLNRGDKLSKREIFYYANELYAHGYYDEAIIQYENFIKHGRTIEQIVYSYIRLSDCYYIKNNVNRAKSYCYTALKFGMESAEVLCRLGLFYLKTS